MSVPRMWTGSVLNQHINFIHFKIPRKKEAHQFNKCGKLLVSLGSLMAYMRTHSGSRPYQCQECGYKFTTGSVLNRHINFIHFKIPRKKEAHQCNKGGEIFIVSLGSLMAYMRTHSGSRPYQCQECGYKFTTGSVLNRHINFSHFKIPRKNEAHQCNKCGEILVSLGFLIAYMRTHSGSRPYQCQECRYKFTTRSVLN